MYTVKTDVGTNRVASHEKENIDQVMHMVVQVIKLKLEDEVHSEIAVTKNETTIIYIEV